MKPIESLRNAEDVADSLAAMIKKELTVYKCVGYLDPSDTSIITADDRMAIVDWCYYVVDHCQFSRQIVASAMEMVDRFLCIPSQVSHDALHNQKDFQILTVSSLCISIKMHETIPIGSNFFSKKSRGAYKAVEIDDMERTLLSGLSWRCHAPTAHQFGLSILSLLVPKVDLPEVTWGFLVDEMKYLTELAVRDYYFSTQRASTIALAAILIASDGLDFKPRQDFMKASSSIFVHFGFEDIDDLIECKNNLASLMDDASEIVCEREEAEDEGVTLILTSNNQCNDFGEREIGLIQELRI
jgi:hypothetical protein